MAYCLILSNFIAQKLLDLQLLSGLLLPQSHWFYRSSAIFNSRYKSVELKIYSYLKLNFRILTVYLTKNH